VKAVVCRTHGSPDDLRVEDVDQPAVDDRGVLVRVHSASINPADFFTLTPVAYAGRAIASRFKPKPVIVGTDFSGTVEAVGQGVTRFRVGDEAFGFRQGAFAEYVCVPEDAAIAHKPPNVSMAQAAGVPIAATTALQAVRDHGRLRPRQKVLINGASGGVGTFAVQVAAAFGGDVTAVCSPRQLEIVHSLGANRVIDYTREDFSRDDRHYDLLLDIAGNRSWAEYARILTPEATFVAIGGSAHIGDRGGKTVLHFAHVRLASLRQHHRVVVFIARENEPDLVVLQDLMVEGKVSPVVDRHFSLQEVPAAFHYLAEGHARGKIVVDVTP
jgi:NADPH:quinone reductase-like Zn-dependent oxidoreductase